MRNAKWLAVMIVTLGVSAPAWSQNFLGLGSSTVAPATSTATSATASTSLVPSMIQNLLGIGSASSTAATTPTTTTPTQSFNWSSKFQDYIPSLPKIFQQNTYPGTSAYPTPANQPGAAYLQGIGLSRGKVVHLSN